MTTGSFASAGIDSKRQRALPVPRANADMTLGFALYVTVPYAGASGNVVLFVICFLVIVSMKLLLKASIAIVPARAVV